MVRPPSKHGVNQVDSTSLSSLPTEITSPAYFAELRKRFRQAMQKPLSQVKRIGEADIVVGIPFYNETATIQSVVKMVRRGLEEFYPERKSVIVAAGSPFGGETLKELQTLPDSEQINQLAFLLNDEHINGKGWALRAIMEIARGLCANLAIVEADLRSRKKNGEVEGLAPDWVSLLLAPILDDKMDLVISRFNRHYLQAPVSTRVFYPILTAIYNCPIHDLTGGQWGISCRLIPTYLKKALQADANIGSYGIDSWLATTAITSGARICETNLGIKIHRPTLDKTELVLRKLVGALFHQIVADREWIKERNRVDEMPLLQPLATLGTKKSHRPDEVKIFPQQLVARYKRGFNRFHQLYRMVMPEEIYQQLEMLAGAEAGQFVFPPELWVRTTYYSLLDFVSRKVFAKDDVLDSFIPLYEGCIASSALELQALRDRLGCLPAGEAEHLVSLEAELQVERIADEFVRHRSDFLAAWEMREEAFRPALPKVTYREFIPGVPLVVPLDITSATGTVMATANGIYESIFCRYEEEFRQFIYGELKTPKDASSADIVKRIWDFMLQVEKELDDILLPGDLADMEGSRQVADAIFRYLPHKETFALTTEMAKWLLQRTPPSNLLTKLGFSSLNALFEKYQPNDVLALAAWSEEQEYVDQILALVRENARREHFQDCRVSSVVVGYETLPSLVEMKEVGSLGKLAGRIVISSQHKGMGGEFPKLHYFTHTAKNIIELERFGNVWRRFAEQRIDFGEKVINSLVGHWGREPLSAHNFFENGLQRVLVERLRAMVRWLHQEGKKDKAKLIDLLNKVIDSYHLAITLPDGKFVPCSAWTWASYSFKGGTGLPTPLSLHVERDWAAREFLTEYFSAIGGTKEAIDEKIIGLMGEGREWEELTPILLGTVKEADKIIPARTVAREQPPAGALTRFGGNPILEPVKEHPWESKYVFNPGAIRIKSMVHLVYRAVGDDGISRLGLASSPDGFKFTERLQEPIFKPVGKNEEKGCEDPRLILIGKRIYMVYIAYDGLVSQIAMASITVDDFVNHRWGTWRRHGLVFPGFTDKNATLFPEQFEGKFALLHRVDPHIWVTFSSHLRCPWSHKENRILAGSTSGMAWDGNKIGAGSQPIKTKYGWLLITHGVNHDHIYRLGVMLLDLSDPTVVLYRSPNAILEPEEKYELGEPGTSWVHNVIFTCGAAPRDSDKKMLEADDEILIYYGGADTVACVATAKVGGLIPTKITEG